MIPISDIMWKVLIIEDDELYRQSIACALTASGMTVKCLQDGHSAVSVAADFQPDVVLVDWMLRTEQNGRDVAMELKQISDSLKLILITGYLSLDEESLQRDDLFDAIVTKPFRTEWLRAAIECVSAA